MAAKVPATPPAKYAPVDPDVYCVQFDGTNAADVAAKVQAIWPDSDIVRDNGAGMTYADAVAMAWVPAPPGLWVIVHIGPDGVRQYEFEPDGAKFARRFKLKP